MSGYRPRKLRCAFILVACAACAMTVTSARVARGQAVKAAEAAAFPAELVHWKAAPDNPVFTAEGAGHWDVKIRERGWILREGDAYHLWFTGYDGTRDGIKLLGYATSSDGLHWSRSSDNPLVRDHWVEDMMVVKQGDTYYMFAEGLHDQAQLLTSKDRVHWNLEGPLEIHYTSGKPLTPGPFGTPTAWLENGAWHLFYERMDLGVWLAKSDDPKLKVWTNVQDEPVLTRGPAGYDKQMIAMNQVIKHRGAYYATYHGTGDDKAPRAWTTNLARSTDLVHWEKYPGNPIVPGDKSSGILVSDGEKLRLYTMHEKVELYVPRGE
jgi:beta-1,2-mannobiose phosphorylase / 1,2-beta-oligomannan phosphorylase